MNIDLQAIRAKLICTQHWQLNSLLIDRGHPVTKRIVVPMDNYEAVLHVLYPCKHKDTWIHCHAWPMETICLEGGYIQEMYLVRDHILLPTTNDLFTIMTVAPGTSYTMSNPLIFHRVIPYQICYTIMCRGSDYENPHSSVRRTKNKELSRLQDYDKIAIINKFIDLIG